VLAVLVPAVLVRSSPLPRKIGMGSRIGVPTSCNSGFRIPVLRGSWKPSMDAVEQLLLGLCRDVLRPLIEADNGRLYLVSLSDGKLALHLGGACSGCPGASITIRTLIEPAVHAVDPNTQVFVTVGTRQPPHAVLLEADAHDTLS